MQWDEYFRKRSNVCIQGKVLTKEQNQGNGFGPLGKYSQAVSVESLC